MIGLYFLIGALALLAAILLFGFVGCTSFGEAPSASPPPKPGDPPPPPDTPPDYYLTITRTPDLVAYWRLGEPDQPVPTSGGKAKSQVGGFHGDYFTLNPVTIPDNLHHSPATAGKINLGITPGLLELKPQDSNPCIQTDGGYVKVPFNDALNPPQFTFEAWVSPDSLLDPKFYYCLVESTGKPGTFGKKTGWGLYLGPADITSISGPLHWQVWMGDGLTAYKMVAIANGTDTPTKLRLTYLALTFDGQNLQLFLYYPNTNQEIGIKTLRGAQNPNVTNFKRNDNSATTGRGDFFIGTGSNLTLIGAAQRLYPFKGKIQEVALYKRDLSAPNNAGLQSTLASHEMNGGNL
jgi:hypothetical protein